VTTATDWHLQGGYDVRFEWGTAGTSALADRAGILAVVDVLRFTTAVEAAVARAAVVYPYRWRDDSAGAFAASVGASLADGTDPSGPSLSPLSLGRLSSRDAVVLRPFCDRRPRDESSRPRATGTMSDMRPRSTSARWFRC
jgi:hypothetical protein